MDMTKYNQAMSQKYWQTWNADVQARIDRDIEANRKADGAFEVDAPDGALVRVEQIDHAFRFGAHIFNFNRLGKTEYNDAYKASYGKGGLFMSATARTSSALGTASGSSAMAFRRA